MAGLLTGRTALVTGGTLGIGRGIAETLIEHGATVGVTGVTDEEVRNAQNDGLSAYLLDVRSRDDVIGMLDSLADTVRCAVVASHDMELVATWASRVIVLDQGRVLADVTPRELFARPEITRQARLVPPQAARIAHSLGIDPLPLTAAELGEHLRTQQPALMIGGQR